MHFYLFYFILYSFQSGIKGLQLAGLNIVSVTDTTGFTDKYPRGKKRRKL